MRLFRLSDSTCNRERVQARFPDFLSRTCEECGREFSVTSSYYRHMAAHMGLKFMSEAELGDLARETGQPLLPPHGHHHGPQVHVGV